MRDRVEKVRARREERGRGTYRGRETMETIQRKQNTGKSPTKRFIRISMLPTKTNGEIEVSCKNRFIDVFRVVLDE